MHIDAASSADLDDLTRLFAGYLQFYREDKPLAAIRVFLAARLSRGDSVLFLARDAQGRALGFVQLYPFHASLALQPAWLLSDLYVSEVARRQGVGEALMNTARRHAETTGACGLQLQTAKSNLAGQALYERLGYVRDELFHTYWLELSPPDGD
ncbi:GNAT family N-acetyltransferase [Pseudomonas sp. MMS21-TM103]|uniref:GNAT family N-acetyltransferase n=1 Tax=Pseudomonas sp. MMS21 TM103 TaxID=2886506 RepID=UPI001EDE8FB1|nr:GNAT family N-acetyltransferase [Pseudomonas sp. MMS21 TM103]MCG4452455.1 GNAT family N-acetyltransferase [Pseudomonas sp. MMS21 TM103]